MVILVRFCNKAPDPESSVIFSTGSQKVTLRIVPFAFLKGDEGDFKTAKINDLNFTKPLNLGIVRNESSQNL